MLSNLYLFQDILSGGYSTILISSLSLISIACAISVIAAKNPIISVLCLITLFMAVAFYLISSGLSFIGLAYLLVYVGAVSILFLFILMLINIRTSELISNTGNSIPLILLITVLFSSADRIIFSLVSDTFNQQNGVTANNWEYALVLQDHIVSIGATMYSHLAIWLVLVSTILLLAMVGAIVITVKRKANISISSVD